MRTVLGQEGCDVCKPAPCWLCGGRGKVVVTILGGPRGDPELCPVCAKKAEEPVTERRGIAGGDTDG